jgi:hypothetical protein
MRRPPREHHRVQRPPLPGARTAPPRCASARDGDPVALEPRPDGPVVLRAGEEADEQQRPVEPRTVTSSDRSSPSGVTAGSAWCDSRTRVGTGACSDGSRSTPERRTREAVHDW